MWRDSAKEEATFEKGVRLFSAERNVLVTERAAGSYQERRDRVVSTKLAWSDAG